MWKIVEYSVAISVLLFLSLKLSYVEFTEFVLLSGIIIISALLGNIGLQSYDRLKFSNLESRADKRLFSKSRYLKLNMLDIWELSYYSFYLSTIAVSIIGGLLVYLYFGTYNVATMSGWTIFVVSQSLLLERQLNFLGLMTTSRFITRTLPFVLFIISVFLSRKNFYANTAEYNVAIFAAVMLFINITQFLILKTSIPQNLKFNRSLKVRKRAFKKISKVRFRQSKLEIWSILSLMVFLIGLTFLNKTVETSFVFSMGLVIAGFFHALPVNWKWKSSISISSLVSMMIFVGDLQIWRQYYSDDIYWVSLIMTSLLIIKDEFEIKFEQLIFQDFFIVIVTTVTLIPFLGHYGACAVIGALIAKALWFRRILSRPESYYK